MANTSEQIRVLARSGVPVVEIARRVGVRYQYAYGVCSKAGLLSVRAAVPSDISMSPISKPGLSVATLLERGFQSPGPWTASNGRLVCPTCLPRKNGVYAISVNDDVVYVGLASRSLAQRIYFYGNPGVSQRTNIRLNALILETLSSGTEVQIHYACPPSFSWNGFTVCGPEGLEAGLIGEFLLPWNKKGT